MIAAIGAFDGYHLGHQALLSRAEAKARERGTRWGVITFTDHPDVFFARRPCADGNAPCAETPFKSLFVPEEQRLLERFFAIPEVHRIDFTEEIARMAPDEFLSRVGREFGVRGIVVGEDFRFGRGRSGDAASLSESCSEAGWSLDVIPMRLSSDGRPICSTAVRDAVANGEMRLAWEFLGYPFFTKSAVVHGLNRGASLGFPTANVEIRPRKIGMRHGVYATLAHIGGAWLAGAANVGLNPTFSDVASPRFEVNLLDYDGDLYGSEITVFTLDHLRDEIRFASAGDLAEQIARDTEAIRKISEEALSRYKPLWERFSRSMAAGA
ncbi:MAG: riboflavin biosynthesis protein RibF [Synergistaceae bacterium]|nr:riboflavin biosynthesis protein RibF [Synergistaceae bacterium]